jgi:hypothetical protein
VRKLFAGLMAAAALAAVAEAAPDLQTMIGQCAAKPDGKERLACYDAIAQRLGTGHAAATPGPAAAPPTAAVQRQPEAQFGAESLKKEARAGQPQQLDEIHGAIAKLTFSPTGRAIVTLDNGQVWRQVEGDSDRFKGKQGEKATIARAILGSYNLTVEGRNQLIKVQRVR